MRVSIQPGGEGVVGLGVEGESLGDEIDPHPAAGQVPHELGEVDDGAGEAVHRGHPGGVTGAHVALQPRVGRLGSSR